MLAFLSLGLVACLAWSASSTNQQRAAFEQETRILQRLLTQRAEQQEAVLSSLIALDHADLDDARLVEFAHEMRGRYPQIVAIETCARPSPREVVCGDPITLSPTNFVLDEEARVRALKLAASEASGAPLSLTTSHSSARTYLFGLSQSSLEGDTRRAFTLWIDPDRWLSPGERPDPESVVSVTTGDGQSVVHGIRASRPSSTLERRFLPHFRLEKALGSASQPFVLIAHRQLEVLDLPLGGMAGLMLGAALLSVFVGRTLDSSQRARFEQQRAEAALQLERTRAQGTVYAVVDALLACDERGAITLVNPAARTLLGASADELLGRTLRGAVRFQATLGQHALPDLFDAFWSTPETMELPEGIALIDDSAQLRLVEGSLAPLHDERGGFAGAVLICRDLGPYHRRMQAALEHNERRLREHEAALAHMARLSTAGEIASGLAHELSQPLTAILSHAQASLRFLEDEAPDLERVKRSLRSAADQAKRSGAIIQRLRDYLSKRPLRRDRVQLSQIVENVRVLTEHELEDRDIALTVRLDGGPLVVNADPIGLEQVIHNLLRNAIEALEFVDSERRRIEVTAWRDGSSIRLSVRDHGPGIPVEVLGQLFMPFVTTKPSGMGLGLSLSQTLLQGMGGELGGENCADGGARFALKLPMVSAEVTDAELQRS